MVLLVIGILGRAMQVDDERAGRRVAGCRALLKVAPDPAVGPGGAAGGLVIVVSISGGEVAPCRFKAGGARSRGWHVYPGDARVGGREIVRRERPVGRRWRRGRTGNGRRRRRMAEQVEPRVRQLAARGVVEGQRPLNVGEVVHRTLIGPLRVDIGVDFKVVVVNDKIIGC